MKTITFIVLFVVVVAVNSAVDFSSCARMDVPGLSKVAQGLCISSCKYQTPQNDRPQTLSASTS
uniref:Uncharacterized protein n=1 Tax=Parascaris equorum TaxID=6256 RepID=A0A914S6Y6_PAREQ